MLCAGNWEGKWRQTPVRRSDSSEFGCRPRLPGSTGYIIVRERDVKGGPRPGRPSVGHVDETELTHRRWQTRTRRHFFPTPLSHRNTYTLHITNARSHGQLHFSADRPLQRLSIVGVDDSGGGACACFAYRVRFRNGFSKENPRHGRRRGLIGRLLE